ALWALVGVLLIGAFALIWQAGICPPRMAVAQAADEAPPSAEEETGLEVVALQTIKGRGLGYITSGRTQLLAAGTTNGVRVYQVRGYGGSFSVRDVTAEAEQAGAAPAGRLSGR
ncbi:MAG: hypothetical protein ACE5O2_14075, partial [Armatimonadota bacterium]